MALADNEVSELKKNRYESVSRDWREGGGGGNVNTHNLKIIIMYCNIPNRRTRNSLQACNYEGCEPAVIAVAGIDQGCSCRAICVYFGLYGVIVRTHMQISQRKTWQTSWLQVAVYRCK